MNVASATASVASASWPPCSGAGAAAAGLAGPAGAPGELGAAGGWLKRVSSEGFHVAHGAAVEKGLKRIPAIVR